MVYDKIKELVELLAPSGLKPTCDPQQLNPECVWICPRRVVDWHLCGDSILEIDLYLIARANGVEAVYRRLDEALPWLMKYLDGLDIRDMTLDENVTLPQGGGPMPAYKITIHY